MSLCASEPVIKPYRYSSACTEEPIQSNRPNSRLNIEKQSFPVDWTMFWSTLPRNSGSICPVNRKIRLSQNLLVKNFVDSTKGVSPCVPYSRHFANRKNSPSPRKRRMAQAPTWVSPLCVRYARVLPVRTRPELGQLSRLNFPTFVPPLCRTPFVRDLGRPTAL